MKDMHIVKNCDGGKGKPCLVHFELGCLTSSNLTAVVAVAAVAYFLPPKFPGDSFVGYTTSECRRCKSLFFSLYFLGP